jgi:hypothetical protein
MGIMFMRGGCLVSDVVSGIARHFSKFFWFPLDNLSVVP